MSTTADFGSVGPHPDVSKCLAEHINQERHEMVPSESGVVVGINDIHILHQRTLRGLEWSNLWGERWLHDVDTVEVDVSVGLVMCIPTGGRKQLVQYQAQRLLGKTWTIARMSTRWLDEPPKKPWTSIFSLSRGLGIAWGALTHSSEIGKARVTLADGRIAESSVSNSSLLLLVPFNSAELWSSTVRITIYDTQGRKIVDESHPLPTSSPTSDA